VNFSNRWGRDIERLARRRNVSEEDLLEHLLTLAKEEKDHESVRTVGKDNTIFLKTLSRRVTISMARAVWREIGGYFGRLGQSKLSPEEKRERGKKAAEVRWTKQRDEQGKKKKPEG
jgi:chromosome condensin MukBEF MukE localization factor